MRRMAIIIIVLIAAGCSNRTPENKAEEALAQAPAELEAAEEQAAEEQAPAGGAAESWSEEGLMAQPQFEELIRQTNPEIGEPASTDWQEFEAGEQAVALRSGSPGGLLAAVSETLQLDGALGVDVWEVTRRIHQNDEEGSARGVILSWGLKDDSIAGTDMLVEMSTDGEAWRVEKIEQRAHCRRGVGERGFCL